MPIESTRLDDAEDIVFEDDAQVLFLSFEFVRVASSKLSDNLVQVPVVSRQTTPPGVSTWSMRSQQQEHA